MNGRIKILVICAFCIFCLNCQEIEKTKSQIKDERIENFPYLISILDLKKRRFICDATILSPNFAITSANCGVS